jgi:glutamyl-tRNA(Gln) amidotransferase subunit E
MDYEKINLKVGLEIHQQLNVGRKLFCNCPTIETEEFDARILRKLRPTQSELGQVDPAALYEFRKGKSTIYLYNKKSACLVESDEEPPHPINMDAVKAAIIVALSLNSKIVQEMHVMRKIVIDGSNTTGFQRTVLVALGGFLKVDDLVVPVQTISLEEDAARLIEEKEDSKVFSLDRLGIPLVEIALAPVKVAPRVVESIALELGRLLRLTKLVARGLGTIRQDLNISVHGLLPSEAKGVQKLDLIPKIVEYEANRQNYLYQIANTLKGKGLDADSSIGNYVDVSEVFHKTSSQFVKKALAESKGVYGLKLKGFKGLLGNEPLPNIRLGLELAEIARANGLGGVSHSDELPAYGISQEEVDEVRKLLGLDDQDGFFLLLTSLNEGEVMDVVRQRAFAFFNGPVPETRGPVAEGRTKYSRPRPGAARMYPETDIPLISVTDSLIKECRAYVPKSWNKIIKDYSVKYNLNEKLVIQLLDSNYLSLFENMSYN